MALGLPDLGETEAERDEREQQLPKGDRDDNVDTGASGNLRIVVGSSHGLEGRSGAS